jgi:hypothetical protein
MFDSNIFGVITGMVFFYLMLGLICSVFGEAIAGMLAWRAGNTYKGFKDMFFDPEGDRLIDKVYQHPLIEGLRRPTWWDSVAKMGSKGAGKPNEIPMVNFVHALRDTVEHGPELEPKTSKVVQAVLDSDKEQAEELWQSAEGQLTDRYRAKMQWLIVGLAIAVTAVCNGDTLLWFNSLWTNAALRDSVSRITTAVAQQGVDNLPAAIDVAKDKLHDLGIFGWSTDPKDLRVIPDSLGGWLSKVVGLLITTVVVARTAPYAFDFFRYAVQFMGRKANMPQAQN